MASSTPPPQREVDVVDQDILSVKKEINAVKFLLSGNNCTDAPQNIYEEIISLTTFNEKELRLYLRVLNRKEVQLLGRLPMVDFLFSYSYLC